MVDDVAWAGLAISVVSLGLSLATWLLSGAWIRVSARKGSIFGSTFHSGVVVTARNGGRGPASIEQVMLLLPDKRSGCATPETGPAVTHRLEGGEHARWLFDYEKLRAFMAASYPTKDHFWLMRPAVRLAADGRLRLGATIWVWEPGYVGFEVPPPEYPMALSERLRLRIRRLLRHREPVFRLTDKGWEPLD